MAQRTQKNSTEPTILEPNAGGTTQPDQAFKEMCRYHFACQLLNPKIVLYTAVYLAAATAFDEMGNDGEVHWYITEAIRDAMKQTQKNRTAGEPE